MPFQCKKRLLFSAQIVTHFLNGPGAHKRDGMLAVEVLNCGLCAVSMTHPWPVWRLPSNRWIICQLKSLHWPLGKIGIALQSRWILVMIKLFVKRLLHSCNDDSVSTGSSNDAGNSFSASNVLSGAGSWLEVVNLWDEGQTGSGREGVRMVLYSHFATNVVPFSESIPYLETFQSRIFVLSALLLDRLSRSMSVMEGGSVCRGKTANWRQQGPDY